MPTRLFAPSKVSNSPVAKRRDRYFDTNSGFSFALDATKARMLNTVRVDVRLVTVIITVSKFDIMTAWRAGILRVASKPVNVSLKELP